MKKKYDPKLYGTNDHMNINMARPIKDLKAMYKLRSKLAPAGRGYLDDAIQTLSEAILQVCKVSQVDQVHAIFKKKAKRK